MRLRNNTNQAFFLHSYSNIKNYFLSNFTNRTAKTCHSYILLHFLYLYLSNFDYIYFAFTVIFFTVTVTHWSWKMLRKLPRTISQESVNVLMNEILINLLQQNKPEKFDGGERKEDTIRYGCQLRNMSGRAAARSIAITHNASSDDESSKWWEQRWRRRWWYLPAKFARSLGWNWRRNVKIGFNAIHSINVSGQIAMSREIFLQVMIFFVLFASDHKC